MTVGAARSGGVSSYVYDAVGVEEVVGPRRRRPRRDRHRRPDHEHHPALGRQHVRRHRVLQHRRRLVARRQPQRRTAGCRPRPKRPASSRRTTPASRSAARSSATASGSTGQYRNLDTQTAVEGITANANAGNAARWDWMSSPVNARLVQDRQMAIGRFTGQAGRSRIQVNYEYQKRCEGTPLTTGRPRLPQPRRGLGRPRHDDAVAGSDGHRGARLLRVAVPPDAGVVDDAG